MRSRTVVRCGEVYRPILEGVERERRWALRMEEVREEVEPLPFVPAMWRTLRRLRSAGWEASAYKTSYERDEG